MYYPTIQHVKAIIEEINKSQHTKIVIINSGQLEFALEKPKMNIYGNEKYSKLYQKAAILMETITKAHALSDGNKRTAMLTAQAMIRANGGMLILPLKSIRLAVDTAKDTENTMSEIIQQWFKTHIAMDVCQLCAMLTELDEEEGVIKEMPKQDRTKDVNDLLNRWMVFDNYPESKDASSELIRKWGERENLRVTEHATIQNTNHWPHIWNSFMSLRHMPHAQRDYPTSHSGDTHELKYNYNNMVEIQAAENRINEEVAKCKEMKDASLVHKNALRLERYGMYNDAIDMFDKLRTLSNDESHAVFHIAIITQEELNDAKSAMKYWNLYIKSCPDDPLGHLGMGRAFIQLGQYSDALDCFAIVSSENLDYTGIDFDKGFAHYNLHNYNKAIECCKKEILINPRNAQAYEIMGIAYANIGNHERAAKCFEMVTRIDPAQYSGYYNKGLALQNLDKNKEAMTCYKKALDIKPDYLEAKINLGSAMSNSGKIAESLPYFHSALRSDPEHPVALYALTNTLMKLNRKEEALTYADRLERSDSSHTSIKYLKADILAHMGRIDECIELLETLASIDPDFKKSMSSNISNGMFGTIMSDKRFKNLV